MNKIDIIDNSIILTGIGISLIDLQNLLSIIILVIDLLWLGIKYITKFFRYIKDGKLTDEEKEDLKKDRDNIINKEDK